MSVELAAIRCIAESVDAIARREGYAAGLKEAARLVQAAWVAHKDHPVSTETALSELARLLLGSASPPPVSAGDLVTVAPRDRPARSDDAPVGGESTGFASAFSSSVSAISSVLRGGGRGGGGGQIVPSLPKSGSPSPASRRAHTRRDTRSLRDNYGGLSFGGRPPFAPLVRAARVLAGDVALPPLRPSATAWAFFRAVTG